MRGRGDGQVVAAVAVGDRLHEPRRQDGNVVGPLAQRRQVQRDQVDAVEQVLAELAARDLVGERAVRGRDDAHVDRPRLARAEHLVGAVLEDAEQLHLRARVEIADFVEEDRAAVGNLEAAPAIGARVGEGPADVAEHLALEERGRDAAEVHLDERTAPAPAVAVDRFGDELLAGAALAGDEHGRVGQGHAAGELEDPEQPRVAADHLAEVVARIQLFAGEQRVLAGPVVRHGQPERCGDALEELLVRPRLGDEVGRARLHALHRQRDRPPGGEENHRHLGPGRFEAGEQVQAFLARRPAREVHVLDDEREARTPRCGDRLLRRGSP